jgi:hypothetical protein
MDPYIEAYGLWEGFHYKLIGEIERSLSASLPDRYFVEVGERSYIVLAGTNGKETSPFLPDVGVRSPSKHLGNTGLAVAETATEAVTLRAFIDERFRENFIEIHERDSELRLVTSIELLSPSNKRRGTEGWDLYLRKRQALMLGSANLVEIDLLRGGQRFPMADPWPNSPYYLLVCRQSRAPYCRVQPATYRQPLPELSIPLASPDPDVPVALQPMIDAIYARSRYCLRIDYAKPIKPLLSRDDRAWLTERLPAAAKKQQPRRQRRKKRG